MPETKAAAPADVSDALKAVDLNRGPAADAGKEEEEEQATTAKKGKDRRDRTYLVSQMIRDSRQAPST